MVILAVETSCDDTCCALIEARGKKRVYFKILSNIVSSQTKIHRKFGGVYPSLAKRKHQKNLPLVLKKALREAKNPKFDLLSVTVGPGLEPCLWTGVNFAKNLAEKWNLPLIPINHIEAHIFVNFIKKHNASNLFPAICLVVSGGHTQLILVNDFMDYKILGETRDDAAGECFDKTARILGLSYPGGPEIAKRAKNFQKSKKNLKISLPRPMINQKNYDFSFSGLKTAVLYDFKNRSNKKRLSKNYINEMAAEIQQAIINVLLRKTLKAAKNHKAKTIILGGGVAANEKLRRDFKEKTKKDLPKIKLLLPEIKFCTDNAAMIGATAYFYWLKGGKKNWKEIKANANLKIDESI